MTNRSTSPQQQQSSSSSSPTPLAPPKSSSSSSSSLSSGFKVSPPGATAQYINNLLHVEPFSFIFHGLFWAAALVFVFPFAGCFVVLRAILVPLFPQSPKRATIFQDKKKNEVELAVYISGCDSGFGKDLAFSLAAREFVVFPGCVSDAGFEQYQGNDNIIPLRVDVTKDVDCVNAASSLQKWLTDPSAAAKPRFLHAIVNNAGIGAAGLIDWTPLSTFERLMDVNYYGTIRTTKAFLPILKSQYYSSTYTTARVINVGSVSGLFAGNLGSSSYSGSKHAVEAFSSCLRLELKAFDLSVVTLNPSSHGTAIGLQAAKLLEQSWDALDTQVQTSYGEEYFRSLLEAVANLKKFTWNPKYVQDALVSSIEAMEPSPQVIVGMDAKYFVLLVRLLPMWVQVKVLALLASKAVPSCMKD